MGERRATRAAVSRLAADLSERDLAIVADVARVHVLSGRQVERVHFAHLEGAHGDRTRRRVLERLVAADLLTTLPRRIGGGRAGSAGLIFALGLHGQQLVALENDRAMPSRTRRPGVPTDRFLNHTLEVAELYVCLVEATREGSLTLSTFKAEPGCWWRSSDGEWIKPDALTVVSAGEVEDSWAIEVDRATESLPTLRRKLKVYVDLALQQDHGPAQGPLPRVLVTVPDERRLAEVHTVLASLPELANDLIVTTVHSGAISKIANVL